MLVVPALEFGDPVLLFVLMEADDPLLHARGAISDRLLQRLSAPGQRELDRPAAVAELLVARLDDHDPHRAGDGDVT